MAINFPSSPSINDVHTENSLSWEYNGKYWIEIATGSNQDVVATGSTTSRSLADRFAQTFHVNDFGVTGQGNDTAIINAALAHIDSIGGGILLHDNTTYELTDKIIVGKNTTLRGKTNTIYKRVAYTTTLLSNELNITSSTSGYTGNGNLTIENITFDGNTKNYYTSGNLTAIGYAENVIIRGCTFLDVVKSHAIDLSSCRDVLIENNKFLGFSVHTQSPDGYDNNRQTWADSGDRSYAEAVQLDHNVTGSFFFGAIDATPNLNVIFKDNIVGKNPAHNDNTFTSYGVGIGGHGTRRDRFMENVKIVDNTFNDCLYTGVRPFKWKNTHIVGNTFNNCKRDVHFTNTALGSTQSYDVNENQTNLPQSGENVVIEGNTFKGTVEQSIIFTEPLNKVANSNLFEFTKNVIIANNTFKIPEPSNETIDLAMVSNAQITGNVFDKTPRCIRFSYVNNTLVSGNVANDVSYEFLWVKDHHDANDTVENGEFYLNNIANTGLTNNITVAGNSINKCGRSAINFRGSHEQISVIGNTIVDGDQEVGGDRPVIAFYGGDNGEAGPHNITVTGNSSVKSTLGKMPYRGVWVTSSCSNAFLGLNSFHASDNPEVNSASGDTYRVFDRTTNTDSYGQREKLAFTAQNSTSDGGQINLYGKNDARFPNSVLVDLGQSDTNGNFIITDCPTSPSGLPNGAVYSDGGILKIV